MSSKFFGIAFLFAVGALSSCASSLAPKAVVPTEVIIEAPPEHTPDQHKILTIEQKDILKNAIQNLDTARSQLNNLSRKRKK